MLIFSRIVLLYFVFNTGMKALSYLSYPQSTNPIAPLMVMIFGCMALAGVYFAYKLNSQSRTSNQRFLIVIAKLFVSLIGLISIGRAVLGLMFIVQSVGLNDAYTSILILSLIGHIATVIASTYFLLFHFKANNEPIAEGSE